MFTYSQLSVVGIAIVVTIFALHNIHSVPPGRPADHHLVTAFIAGNSCNGFGHEQYVQNTDTRHGYAVTIKMTAYQPGVSSVSVEKTIQVAMGGKVFAGCSQSPDAGGPAYTFTIISEAKQ